jgi:tetratricopeptide (TPR) repeat protein
MKAVASRIGRQIGLAVAIIVCIGGTTAAPISEHAEAVDALTSAQADDRREAVAWFADSGTGADAEFLLDALVDEDRQIRAEAESALWRLWSRSGDREIDSLLESGVSYMNEGRMAQALEIFTDIIERKPDFAEGWNKRATAYYLIGDFERSLRDCDEVIKRNPHHFGALSGYGLIYVKRGELEQALHYFERALAVNPNMTNVEENLELIRYQLRREGKHET